MNFETLDTFDTRAVSSIPIPTPREPALAISTSVITYFLALTIIAVRNPVPWLRAEFWAEDGTDFFRDALARGVGSLVMPVTNYHQLVPRVIAFIATAFPVFWAPYVYAIACLLLNALAVAYFSRRTFEPIVPSTGLRVFTCLLLATGPGSAEVFFNLCNLQTPLLFLCVLMLLESPFQVGPGKFLVFIALFLTAGTAMVIVPLLLYLSWARRDRVYLLLLACLLVVIPVNLWAYWRFPLSPTYSSWNNIWLVPKVLLENFATRLFFAPLGGPKVAGQFMLSPGLIFWPVTLAVIAATGLLIKKYRRQAGTPLLVAYVCTNFTFGLIILFRAYSAHSVMREAGNIMWTSRYSFLPGCFAILAWACLFSSAWQRGRRAIALGGLTLLAAHHIADWKHVPGRPPTDWPEKAARIERALEDRRQGTLNAPVTLEITLQPHRYMTMPVTIEP